MAEPFSHCVRCGSCKYFAPHRIDTRRDIMARGGACRNAPAIRFLLCIANELESDAKSHDIDRAELVSHSSHLSTLARAQRSLSSATRISFE